MAHSSLLKSALSAASSLTWWTPLRLQMAGLTASMDDVFVDVL